MCGNPLSIFSSSPPKPKPVVIKQSAPDQSAVKARNEAAAKEEADEKRKARARRGARQTLGPRGFAGVSDTVLGAAVNRL